MKLSAYWIALAVAIFGAQWIYQPSLELTAIASVLLFGLSAVVGWSATKFGPGVMGAIKTLVVGLVAGFMLTQAMDVAYSVLAAPAGGRLDSFFETATAAIFMTATATLLRLITPGSEVKKQSDGN